MQLRFYMVSLRLEKFHLVEDAAECWCLRVLVTVPIAIAEF
jgi:hypothetical protein